MPEYLAPGVYVEEIERGPKPIEGVATSTAAFVGETARGSTKPKLITNYGQYLRYFGGIFHDNRYMPYAVKAFFDNGGRRCYIARIVAADSEAARAEPHDGYAVRAVGPGESGNRILVKIGPSSSVERDGTPKGFKIQAFYWDTMPPDDELFDPTEAGNERRSPQPSAVEEFDDLSADPDDANYFRSRINNYRGDDEVIGGSSGLIEINVADRTDPPTEDTSAALVYGSDGSEVGLEDYRGGADNPNQRRGLAALDLDAYRDVAIVYAPDVGEDIAGAVITHCERNRFRFAVIDSAQGVIEAREDPRRNTYDSRYAAFYYPWITISDPRTGARRNVPPGGFVCGIYARSDNTRGRVQGAGQRDRRRGDRPRVRHQHTGRRRC